MQNSYAQQLALSTWYAPDDPNAPPKDGQILHACMGLAGEAGEMIDLLKKRMFAKPGFVHNPARYVDELGDFWYYLRVLAALTEISLPDRDVELKSNEAIQVKLLSLMLSTSSYILLGPPPVDDELSALYRQTCIRAAQLDWTMAEVTMLNWLKLRNSSHGWKETDEQVSPKVVFENLFGESAYNHQSWRKVLDAHISLGRPAVGDGVTPPG